MDTSRLILDHLLHNGSATAAELSRVLDLTKADIHYHLRKLLINGTIETTEGIPTRVVGRPARVFKLVENPPLRLTRLVVSVILDLLNSMILADAPTKKHTADRIAAEILSCCPSNREPTYSPAVRLNNLTAELNQFGFIFRWEASRNGPRFFFEREVLSTLIDDPRLVSEIITALTQQILNETA